MGLEDRGPVLFALCLSLSLVQHPAHGRRRTRQTLTERTREQAQWGEGVTAGAHEQKSRTYKTSFQGLFHPRSQDGPEWVLEAPRLSQWLPFPLPQFRVDSPGGGWTRPSCWQEEAVSLNALPSLILTVNTQITLVQVSTE